MRRVGSSGTRGLPLAPDSSEVSGLGHLGVQLVQHIRTSLFVGVSVGELDGPVTMAREHRPRQPVAGRHEPLHYLPCPRPSARVRTTLAPNATRKAGSAVMTGQIPSDMSKSCR